LLFGCAAADTELQAPASLSADCPEIPEAVISWTLLGRGVAEYLKDAGGVEDEAAPSTVVVIPRESFLEV
jgi:hypothetical protein